MFAWLETKWGAKLNTKKTCALTSTKGLDVPAELMRFTRIGKKSVGTSLQRAIKTYYTKLADKRVDVLRILGVPIGLQAFCQNFIKEQVAKMDADATVLLSGLDDFQIHLQLFKTCTSHKMTHIVAADVLCSTSKIPDHWHLWNSNMTKAITPLQEKIPDGTHQSMLNPPVCPPNQQHVHQ